MIIALPAIGMYASHALKCSSYRLVLIYIYLSCALFSPSRMVRTVFFGLRAACNSNKTKPLNGVASASGVVVLASGKELASGTYGRVPSPEGI